MGKEGFSYQSESDAFDRNLEAMRITEVKQDLGYPVEEVSGGIVLPQSQELHLKELDAWIEDIDNRMKADKAKAHEIKPWEFRQFNPDHE